VGSGHQGPAAVDITLLIGDFCPQTCVVTRIADLFEHLLGTRRPRGAATAGRLASGEAELELRVVVHVIRRVACPRQRRCGGRLAEMLQNPTHGLPLGDDRQHTQPSVTLGALENVDIKGAAEETRPIEAGSDGVEHACEESRPVPDGDDVRGEFLDIFRRKIRCRSDGRRRERTGDESRHGSSGGCRWARTG
jgi:hypothetical protein